MSEFHIETKEDNIPFYFEFPTVKLKVFISNSTLFKSNSVKNSSLSLLKQLDLTDHSLEWVPKSKSTP